MRYPTWDEFVVWCGSEEKADWVFAGAFKTDERMKWLYDTYHIGPRDPGGLVLEVRSFFNDWDEGIIPSKYDDDATEDELELIREEDKWRKFFNAPATEYKFPHQIHKDEVKRLLREGSKIEAIRYVRIASKMGLKESKDWIDAFQKQEGL